MDGRGINNLKMGKGDLESQVAEGDKFGDFGTFDL
jgi:hypothetical protein